MTKFGFLSIMVPLIGAASAVQANTGKDVLVVTASNATTNQLLVYNSGGTLIQTVLTGGQGGVSGNAGGIEARGNLVAVVNFRSERYHEPAPGLQLWRHADPDGSYGGAGRRQRQCWRH